MGILLLHRHPADQAEAMFRQTGLYAKLEAESPLGARSALEQFRKPDARAPEPQMEKGPAEAGPFRARERAKRTRSR